ncbi:MAG: hypothetical protein U9O64_06685 [Campylobacterota bacterium]|nr:hypothetical protein [Campylobacterota bacterium]
MKKILLSTLALYTLFSTYSGADEITEQLNIAIKAYQEKDYKGAMDELRFVTAQLQKLDAAENQKLLPAPLDGWNIENKSDTQAVMSMLGGAGTSMEAVYTKDTQRVNIQIVANSPMIAMMSMAISNPALMAADPSTKPFRYKKNKGMKRKEGSSSEITLLIAGQILLKLEGSDLLDDTVLVQYLDAIDIKKLKTELL